MTTQFIKQPTQPHTNPTIELNEMLDLLRDARNAAVEARATRKSILDAAQATDEFKAADAATNEADQLCTQLDQAIRGAALEMYATEQDIPNRVTVKIWSTVKLIPDTQKIVAWCKENFLPALKLDEKVFEKAAKDGNIPAELATVGKEPRASIATKL